MDLQRACEIIPGVKVEDGSAQETAQVDDLNDFNENSMKSWKNRQNSAFECSFSPLFGRQFSAILSEEEGLPGESSYNWEKNGALGIMRAA